MDGVVHFEVPADDVKRAKTFYEKSFGWQIAEFPGMEYWGCITTKVDEKTRLPLSPGAINGGLAKRGMVKSPTFTINVEDIDKAVKKITAAGGKVTVPKMPVGGMGFLAYFTDTEGNTIGLWQNAPMK